MQTRRASIALRVDQKGYKSAPKSLRVFKRSKSDVSLTKRICTSHLRHSQSRSHIYSPPIGLYTNHISESQNDSILPVNSRRRVLASEPGNWNDLEELSQSLAYTTLPPKSPEVWPLEFPTSSIRVKNGLQSPKAGQESRDMKKYLADLDCKIVKWVTQTDPIIEQWEIFHRIHDETGILYDSTWLMKRLHNLYHTRSLKSKPLQNCKIYNRLQRIKDKLITLDLLPGVEDRHFERN